MTTAPQQALRPEIEEHFRKWAEALNLVLAQTSGKTVNFVLIPQSDGVEETFLRIRMLYSGPVAGEAALSFSSTSATWIEHAFLGDAKESAEPKPLSPEHKEVLEEFFRQVAGYVGTALKPKWGEIQFQISIVPKLDWEAAASGQLGCDLDAGNTVRLLWQANGDLCNKLSSPPVDSAPPPSPIIPENISFLQDVALGVTLRFGERRMLLREILELVPGSVIELDRRLREPVELLLDGRLLARGEVVVVAGCYGFKVTELAAPTTLP